VAWSTELFNFRAPFVVASGCRLVQANRPLNESSFCDVKFGLQDRRQFLLVVSAAREVYKKIT
jgi:hypothetical protein